VLKQEKIQHQNYAKLSVTGIGICFSRGIFPRQGSALPGACCPECPSKGTEEIQKAVAKDIKTIFYVHSKENALESFETFTRT